MLVAGWPGGHGDLIGDRLVELGRRVWVRRATELEVTFSGGSVETFPDQTNIVVQIDSDID